MEINNYIYKETFAKRLKEARIRTGLTQTQAGEIIGIKQNTLTKYENGTLEPSIETIGRLAECYGISIDWLFGLGQGQKELKPNYEKSQKRAE